MHTTPNKTIQFADLGNISFADAWDLQKQRMEEICAIKLQARQSDQDAHTPNHLFFCEHPHVYTLGKSGKAEHLLIDEATRQEKAIEFFHIERGGDITYHGPGQLVGYPVIDLENFMTDLDRYLRSIEEAIIQVLATYGLKGDRFPGYTGVWIAPETPAARKIAAIGIKCSRWVAMHGFAFNVSTDLGYFGHIVPCGITDKAVTSLANELGYSPEMHEVKARTLAALADVFSWQYVDAAKLNAR